MTADGDEASAARIVRSDSLPTISRRVSVGIAASAVITSLLTLPDASVAVRTASAGVALIKPLRTITSSSLMLLRPCSSSTVIPPLKPPSRRATLPTRTSSMATAARKAAPRADAAVGLCLPRVARTAFSLSHGFMPKATGSPRPKASPISAPRRTMFAHESGSSHGFAGSRAPSQIWRAAKYSWNERCAACTCRGCSCSRLSSGMRSCLSRSRST